MADQKDKVGTRVAGDQDYEVQYFAATHGVSPDEVRDLIEKFGNDRARLEREVKKLRG